MTSAFGIVSIILFAISAILSLTLIIGYICFKEPRKNNGSFIFVISLANLINALHLVLSYSIPSLNIADSTQCKINGAIAIFAGFNIYFYNLAIIAFSKRKLTNLIRSGRSLFTFIAHGLCITLSSWATFVLWETDDIGLDFGDICSKKLKDEEETLTGVLIIALLLIYETSSLYLFFYIKKAFPAALAHNPEAKKYFSHYTLYLIITSVFWPLMASVGAYAEFTSNEKIPVSLVPIYNVSSILQSLTINIYWYRDPLIKDTIKQFMCCMCWKKRTSDSQENVYHQLPEDRDLNLGSLPASNDQGRQQGDLGGSHKSIQKYFMVDYFSRNRGIEMTYSIISSLLTACKFIDNTGNTISLNLKLRETITYDIDQNLVFKEINGAEKEFQDEKCAFMPVKLHVIAPSIFKKFALEDSLQLANSLDLFHNKGLITNNKRPDGGKTQEFFFFSWDHMLLIKTIPDSDLETLQKILPNYYEHHRRNPNSLITRIYGIFKLEFKQLHFTLNLIIMRNVCPYSDRYIEKRFDLKGSKANREVLPRKDSSTYCLIMTSRTLKDLDFDKVEQHISIPEEMRQPLFNIINEDAEFLCSQGLIDYSLILFIVNQKQYEDERRAHEIVSEEKKHRNSFVSIPIVGREGFCYNLGIIDFLGTYDIKKKFEKTAKKVKNVMSGSRPSVNDPVHYQGYFRDYAKKILQVDPKASQEDGNDMSITIIKH